MAQYPYNVDIVAVTLAGMQREQLEGLIHSGMQFTANVVGLASDNADEDTNEYAGDAVVGYLIEQGLL